MYILLYVGQTYAALLIVRDPILLNYVLFLLSALSRLSMSLVQLSGSLGSVQRFFIMAGRTSDQILDVPEALQEVMKERKVQKQYKTPEIGTNISSNEATDGTTVTLLEEHGKFEGSIRVKELKYHFGGPHSACIVHIPSMEIHPNCINTIYIERGMGCTTLLLLLLRHRFERNHITVDEKIIMECTKGFLRSNITVNFQVLRI